MAAVSALDVITFTKSTLKPHHEEIFVNLVFAKTILRDNIKYVGAITEGGMNTWRDYEAKAYNMRTQALTQLGRMTAPKTKHTYPKD